jgi:hypothetical protein
MKNSVTTNKYPLPKDKIWTRLPERVQALEDNAPNYKSFVGLFTQIGTYPTIISGEPLVIGNTYMVQFLNTGDDFSNVGYVADEVPFIATGTTPTAWTNGSTVREIISSVLPVITTIENTLGITLTPSFKSSSMFFLNSNLPVFLENRTFLSPYGSISNDGLMFGGLGFSLVNSSTLISPSFSLGNTKPFVFEIRVYN